MFIDDLPNIHIGEVKEEKIDWRKVDTKEDDDAPASKELIAQLGFDPDKEETEDEDVQSATGGIVYKGYVLRQNLDGTISIFSQGGSLLDHAADLSLAIKRADEIDMQGVK